MRIVGASAWNPPTPASNPAVAATLSPTRGSLRSTTDISSIDPGNSVGLSAGAAAVFSKGVGGGPKTGGSGSVLAKARAVPETTAGTKPSQIEASSPAPAQALVPPPSGPPTFRIVTYAGTHVYCSAPTPSDRDTWLAALHAGLESSYASYQETLSSITNTPGGTVRKNLLPLSLTRGEPEILTPPVPRKQGVGRLVAASLKRRMVGGADAATTNSLNVSAHGYSSPYDSTAPPSSKNCMSCGRYPPLTAFRPASCPLPQYGMECRVDLCQDCLVSQGLLFHIQHISGLYCADAHERAALTRARDEAVSEVEKCVTETRIRRERERLEQIERRKRYEEALQQNAEDAGAREIGTDGKFIGVGVVQSHPLEGVMEGTVDGTIDGGGGIPVPARTTGREPDEGSGGTEDTPDTAVTGGGSSDDYVHATDRSQETDGSWTNVTAESDTLHVESALASSGMLSAGDKSGAEKSSLSGSWADVAHVTSLSPPPATPEAWVNLTPASTATITLIRLVSSSSYLALRRRSRILDLNCRMLESGSIGCAAEFLEILNEHAQEASASAAISGEAVGMKKEAFRVAGDMGAAVRMLKDAALPRKRGLREVTAIEDTNNAGSMSGGGSGNGVGGRGAAHNSGGNNAEMLACILEFLIDLCDEGELSSVAFFWPQLCQIHLQMLPPTDAGSLVRIELMEDFLLTVCVRHSIHLALDTVWGCVADLEESLGSPSTASPACRRRRYAVLRFVCELESLLFDFDGGWGGGNVSLRSMLSPSAHQAQLARDSFGVLQLHRRFGSHHLSRSVRLEKLRGEAEREEEEEQNELLRDDSLDDGSSSDDGNTAVPSDRLR